MAQHGGDHGGFLRQYTGRPAAVGVGADVVEQGFFGLVTERRICRGSFTSVAELVSAIEEYIKAHKTDAKPFSWTKTADQISDKITQSFS